MRCPQAELRQVAVGLLGPNARSIEVTNPDGSSFSIDPYGPEGAYLIVLPAQADANASMSSGGYQSPFGNAWSPRSRRRDPESDLQGRLHVPDPGRRRGRQCHAQSKSGPGLPSASELKSAVHASYVPLDGHPEIATVDGSRRGKELVPPQAGPGGHDAPGPAVAVTFKAPVATTNASSAYVVELRPRASRRGWHHPQ